LNRPGFPPLGLPLHQVHSPGEEPLELKPDVCWQLPLRVRTRPQETAT